MDPAWGGEIWVQGDVDPAWEVEIRAWIRMHSGCYPVSDGGSGDPWMGSPGLSMDFFFFFSFLFD